MKPPKLSILLRNAITLIGFVLMLFIISDIIIIDKHVQYTMMANCIWNNWHILAFIILVVFFFTLLHKKINMERFHHYSILLIKYEKFLFITIAFLLFIIQIIVSWNIYFYTAWDTRKITSTALAIVNKQVPETTTYYSFYPNNIVLTSIFVYILKFAKFIKLFDPYFGLIIVGNMLINLSGVLLVLCVKKLIPNKRFYLLSFFIYLLLIGFSPWLVVPYSDAYGMIFPILAFYIYLHIKDEPKYLPLWLLLGLTCLLGYKIKPTIVIILMAILILEALKLLLFHKQLVSKFILKLVLLFLPLLLIMEISSKSEQLLNLPLEHERSFSYVHFIMMGLNTKTTGAYYNQDVKLSRSIPDKKSREKEEFRIIKKRLHEFGVTGYSKFLAKKTLLIYNDGTFAWGKEGVDGDVIIKEKNDSLSPFLRSIYYQEGKYYDLFRLTTQIVWLFVLLLNLGNVFSFNKSKPDAEYIITLSIIGITLFLLLFEARARYLYCYSPIFVVGAILGLKHILLQRD